LGVFTRGNAIPLGLSAVSFWPQKAKKDAAAIVNAASALNIQDYNGKAWPKLSY